MKNIIYENKILRNTNYYLLCTLYNLEKQKIYNLNSIIKVSEDPEKYKNDLEFENEDSTHLFTPFHIEEGVLNEEKSNNINEVNELVNIIEEKQKEYDTLNIELKDLKIKMEIEKEFAEHKIQNLEIAKQFLEQELLEIQNIIKNNSDYKETDIDKLKKENEMLIINNQQLQFELIRSIKQI
jgi:hypothetical protein